MASVISGAPGAFRVALSVATILVAAGLLMRLLAAGLSDEPVLQQLEATLVAAGCLCAAGLARTRAPRLAWIASVAAGGIAAVEIVSVIRARQPLAPGGEWPVLAAIGVAALTAGTAIAGAYLVAVASARTRTALASRLVVAAAVASVVGGAVWTIVVAANGPNAASGAIDLVPIRVTSRLAVAWMVALGTVGVLVSLAEPVERALARYRATAMAGEPADGRGPGAFLRLLADELSPGAAASRRRGREQERARLAADLHALVLPDLRRAAAAASNPAVPDAVVAGLRDALGDVDELIHARQSVVVDEFGLVAGLEWLAERTEARSSVRVAIEIDDAAERNEPLAIPRDVERAAFRVAMLALDNVVRHAGATHAIVSVSAREGALRLGVSDDGRGFGALAPARGRSGGRGLLDMEAEANAVGGELTVSTGEPGAWIAMAWPAMRRR